MEKYGKVADIAAAITIFIGIIMLIDFQKDKLKMDMAYFFSNEFVNEAADKGYITKEKYDVFYNELERIGISKIEIKIVSRRKYGDVYVNNEEINKIICEKGRIRMEQGDGLSIKVFAYKEEITFTCFGKIRSNGWE